MDSILENNLKNKHEQNIFQSTWEDISEFFSELWDLLYIDFQNSYIFLSNNKNYFLYAVILTILLQFTNINNIEQTFKKISKNDMQNKYNKHNKHNKYSNINLTGGAAGISTFQQDQQIISKHKNNKLTSARHQNLTQRYGADLVKGLEVDEAKSSSKKAYDAQVKDEKRKESESKINEKRLSFFEKLKSKYGKNTKFGEYGILGPVFGNMEKIFESVKTLFYIITIILTIAGVLSLPVLIFLIITYMVFKSMVSRFVGL